MNSILRSLLLLAASAATTTSLALPSQQQRSPPPLPLNHYSEPSLLWNQAVRSAPANGNVVQISPDDRWLYVTSADGTLSKLDPATGGYVGAHVPERRNDDDGEGGTIIDAGDPNGWAVYGNGGISFHVAKGEEDDDAADGADAAAAASYLVYWVIDVPPSSSSGLSALSRVIAVRHDDSREKEMEVLWTKTLHGSIQGTPVIGSEGKFIYFTLNGVPAPSTPSPIDPPTSSPVVAAVPMGTNAPVAGMPTTASPVAAVPATTMSPVATDDAETISSPIPTILSQASNNAATTTTGSPVASNAATTNTIVADAPTSPTDNVFDPSTEASNTSDSGADDASSNSDNNDNDNISGAAYWWVQDTGTQLECVNNTNHPHSSAAVEYLSDNETLANTTLLYSTIFECCSVNLGACEPSPSDDDSANNNNNNNNNRSLQTTTTRQSAPERSGRFIVLSHPHDGRVVYSFDSRDKISIQKHDFAPLEIARRPLRGNYNGEDGESNSQDVLLWGSRRGGDARQGETVLFQLPKDFDGFDEGSGVDTDAWRVRVLESVSWSTRTKPAFSKDGLDVYFAMTGNRFTGWNNGRKFDVAANLGPIPLPPLNENLDSVLRPPVLANNDQVLLLASIDHNRLFAIDVVTGGMNWMKNDVNIDTGIITIPRISPARSDGGNIAYFGKKNSVYAVNVTDGSYLWGEDGYKEPSSFADDPPMSSDFSLSSTGEYLYYARTGKGISALRIAEVIPSEAPTLTPSLKPSVASSPSPSSMPSVVASSSPSTSVMPTVTTLPTVTLSPSKDPDYIPLTLSPTISNHPSMSPSASFSDSPSAAISDNPSSAPSITPTNSSAYVANMPPVVTAPPTANTGAATESPSASPKVFIPPSNNANPPSAAGAEQPLSDSSDAEVTSSPLGTTAIIGIAVGGGIGLILILGVIWYFCQKEGDDDDGVDTDWQQSNNSRNSKNARRDEGTTFQYGGDEEGNPGGNQQHGEGELRW